MTDKELERMTDVGELKKELRGLDRTLTSVRTAMRMNQKQAEELAEAVKAAFQETNSGMAIADTIAAQRAFKLADDVLA